MRFRRVITLLVITLYILYAISLFLLSTYMILVNADGACHMLSRELSLIYENFLAASDFQYLDEVGVCVAPLMARALLAFSISLT